MPPRLMPAGAPPLWDRLDATLDEDDPQAPSAPEYEVDQRIAWSVLVGSANVQSSRLKQNELPSPVAG